MPPQKSTLINDRLFAAITHPTRLHAMCRFWDGPTSPRQIAEEIGEPVNNVTYHVKQLLDLGWIELVERRPARGGRVVEHFYRATRSSQFDSVELEEMGSKGKSMIAAAILKKMSSDISEALLAGTFYERDDNQLTRIPLEVDNEGWEETKEVLDRALEDLLKVKETVLRRTAASGEKTVPTKVEIIHFMSPPPKRQTDASA